MFLLMVVVAVIISRNSFHTLSEDFLGKVSMAKNC